MSKCETCGFENTHHECFYALAERLAKLEARMDTSHDSQTDSLPPVTITQTVAACCGQAVPAGGDRRHKCEMPLASAEGRPACKDWCGSMSLPPGTDATREFYDDFWWCTLECGMAKRSLRPRSAAEPVCAHDVSLERRCSECYEETRDCNQECCDGRQSREAAKDAPVASAADERRDGATPGSDQPPPPDAGATTTVQGGGDGGRVEAWPTSREHVDQLLAECATYSRYAQRHYQAVDRLMRRLDWYRARARAWKQIARKSREPAPQPEAPAEPKTPLLKGCGTTLRVRTPRGMCGWIFADGTQSLCAKCKEAALPAEPGAMAKEPEAPAGFKVVWRSGPGVELLTGQVVRCRCGCGLTEGEPWSSVVPDEWDAGEYDILEPLPAEPSSDAEQIGVADRFAKRNRDIEDGKWPAPRVEPAQVDDCVDCGFDQGSEPHHDKKCPRNTPAPSEPAKAPLSDYEQHLSARVMLLEKQRADLEARLSDALDSFAMADVAREALTRLLAEAEKARAVLCDKAIWWTRKCAEVEMERDKAVATMKHERATCLADARAKEAVLAERARVHDWWRAWYLPGSPMTAGTRDEGIASGATATGGGK